MDAKIKAKWIKALRSGRFRQGRAYLRNGREQCCLGVLCTVLGAKWSGGGPVLDGHNLDLRPKHQSRNRLLSRRTLNLVGLRGRDQKALARMNDSTPRVRFPKIADYIEARF